MKAISITKVNSRIFSRLSFPFIFFFSSLIRLFYSTLFFFRRYTRIIFGCTRIRTAAMLSFHLASIKNTVSKRKRKNPDILVGSFIRIIQVSYIYMYVQMSTIKRNITFWIVLVVSIHREKWIAFTNRIPVKKIIIHYKFIVDIRVHSLCLQYFITIFDNIFYHFWSSFCCKFKYKNFSFLYAYLNCFQCR